MHYFIAPGSWQYLGTPEEEVEEYGGGIPAHIQTDAATQDVGWKQPLTGR